MFPVQIPSGILLRLPPELEAKAATFLDRLGNLADGAWYLGAALAAFLLAKTWESLRKP